MLMPRNASASNMVDATPAWLRIPTPTTEIFATLSSDVNLSNPIVVFAFSSTSIDFRRSDWGTVKVTSVDPSSCAMSWMIMSTLMFASASGEKIVATAPGRSGRSEEHTSELQSLMRISYAVFCLKKKKHKHQLI